MRFFRRVQVTPVLDTSAYAANDQMSTLQTVRVSTANRYPGGEIVCITVLDKAAQSQPLDLFFFDRSVTLAADQAAASISDADMEFCLGGVNILAVDYDATAANTIATVAPPAGLPVISYATGWTIYMALVTRGSPTYAAGSLVISVTAALEEGTG